MPRAIELPIDLLVIAYHNTTVFHDLLFAVAAERLRTISTDPKPLGAQSGMTLVLPA